MKTEEGLGPLDTIPTQPSSIPVLLRCLCLLPLPEHFLLALQFDQQALVQQCWSLAFLSCLPAPGDGDLLCPKESFLKDLTALLCSLVLEKSFPGGFVD